MRISTFLFRNIETTILSYFYNFNNNFNNSRARI